MSSRSVRSVERINGRFRSLQTPIPVILGTFVSASGNDATVNIGDTSVVVSAVGISAPQPGAPVRLQKAVGGRLMIVGFASPLGMGTVAGSATYAAQPVSRPSLLARSTIIHATDSGRFTTSWSGNDPAASMTATGAWFYGSRLQNYLKGSTPATIEIFLPNIEQSNVCRMGQHAYGAKPAGWTGSASEITLDSLSRDGWVALPLSFATYLRDNLSGLTVTSGSGMNRWKGTASDALSGALRFTGTR